MRISDWSSDVCSSDLLLLLFGGLLLSTCCFFFFFFLFVVAVIACAGSKNHVAQMDSLDNCSQASELLGQGASGQNHHVLQRILKQLLGHVTPSTCNEEKFCPPRSYNHNLGL